MSQVLPERRSTASTELWEPFSELDQIGERMRQVLEQSFGGLGSSFFTEAAAWSPPVDVEETDDAYVVKAELPGVKRNDVAIEVVGNELWISGELKEEERKGVLRRRARRTGRFEFRLRLPEQVEPEQVDAGLDEGVLTVRVPKAQRAQRRRIELKGS
jgi:HSP20 family protein